MLSDFIPSSWKLMAFGLAALTAIGALGGVALIIDKHGYDKAVAVLQPQLDAAHHDLGVAEATNAANVATIHSLTAEAAANDLLAQQFADRVTALNQQAADTAATIRKLQHDDQTVDAYLRNPVPAALRSVLNGPEAGHLAAAGAGADANGHPAAAR